MLFILKFSFRIISSRGDFGVGGFFVLFVLRGKDDNVIAGEMILTSIVMNWTNVWNLKLENAMTNFEKLNCYIYVDISVT